MNSLIVFFRTLFGILLPKNRFGDKIYSFINFVFKQGRFPTNKMLFNDVIYRLKVGDEILNPLRIFTTDKEYSKIYVKFMVGEEFCVPTIKIFKKYEDVVDYNFPSECCIKPTHSSGTFIMRTNDSKIDYHKIKEWFSENYYFRSNAQLLLLSLQQPAITYKTPLTMLTDTADLFDGKDSIVLHVSFTTSYTLTILSLL